MPRWPKKKEVKVKPVKVKKVKVKPVEVKPEPVKEPKKISKGRLIELVKERVRVNERRDLSVSEERDPVEVIPNYEYYKELVESEL